MELFRNYAESLLKDLPRDKQTNQAKTQLIAMMTHHYEQLIAQGKMPNEAASEAIFEYGDLVALAPELGIADLVIQQGEPVKDEEAQSFVEASQKLSKVTLWSIGMLTWSVQTIFMFKILKMNFFSEPSRYNAGWMVFFFLFFVPCFVAFSQHFLTASKYLSVVKKIGFRSVDLKVESNWTETIQKRDKKLKCLRVIGLILLIIGVLGGIVLQVFMMEQGLYCGITACRHKQTAYFLDFYKSYAGWIQNLNSIAVLLMGLGSMLCVKVFIEGFAYRFVLGKIRNIRSAEIFKWAWIYWLVVALSFMLIPGPFRRFAFVIDFWPWAMALFMLILLVWRLTSRRKD